MSHKKPNVIRELEANVGTTAFPAKYAAAREYKEEIEGWMHDAAASDLEARATRNPAPESGR